MREHPTNFYWPGMMVDFERAEAESEGVLEFHQRIIDTSSSFMSGL